LLIGTIFCLDLLIVAPFIERSFVMFESILGTWAPMGLIAFTSLATGEFLSLTANRRPFLKWMPERRDLEARMPGDGLLDGESGSTHAITIRCRPDQLWPWLVQMGYGRAGWYSYDRLDNWGHRSSDRLLPAFQCLERGDCLPSTPGGKCFFEVLDLEPEASLVLGSHMTTGPVRSVRWADPSPSVSQRATWSFALVPEGPDDTRLRVRTRAVSIPSWRWMPVNAFFSVAHIIMQRKQLVCLKRRVETQDYHSRARPSTKRC
jgi:proline iminopeptidase